MNSLNLERISHKYTIFSIRKLQKEIILENNMKINEIKKKISLIESSMVMYSIDDDIYGADFDNQIVQKGFYVRFIKDIPINILEDCIHNPQWNEEACLPFGKVKEYQLVGEIKEQPISIHDMRFNQYLLKYCRDLLPEDCENFYDLDDKTTDYFYDHLPTYGCQAGGYPCFTQYDPRENSYQDYDVLLFQLDTVKDIMWGDSGVANFFIRKENLQNEDFSSVLFHWDCC